MSETTKQIWFIEYDCGAQTDNYDLVEANSEEEASRYAYDLACDLYESYAGVHGIASYEEICEEHGVEPDSPEAEELYNEEKENNLGYSAVLYDPEEHNGYLYEGNEFMIPLED